MSITSLEAAKLEFAIDRDEYLLRVASNPRFMKTSKAMQDSIQYLVRMAYTAGAIEVAKKIQVEQEECSLTEGASHFIDAVIDAAKKAKTEAQKKGGLSEHI